ncbi:Hypothetical protein R9X50_00288100 [Acrodontium crateriforme]|uniref:Uncharacterized protein n=1 Tax=Acrodontium crateriforme TaxID=150365 RepID=A0AAQ3RBC9_9PEZI|nr:Hypothetical protein R9X50_00288100 [Acrodontium crateriforme]
MIPISLGFSLLQAAIVIAATKPSPFGYRNSCNSIGAEGTSCLTYDTSAASAFCSAAITVPTTTITFYSNRTDTYDVTSATLVATTYASPPATTTTLFFNSTVTIEYGSSTSYVSTFTAIHRHSVHLSQTSDDRYKPPRASAGCIKRSAVLLFVIRQTTWPRWRHGSVRLLWLSNSNGNKLCHDHECGMGDIDKHCLFMDYLILQMHKLTRNQEVGTVTITPTVTVTNSVLKSATISTTRVITTDIPHFTNATLTKYITTTTTVNQPSAIPTDSFNIFYYNATALSTLYGRGVNTTSGKGTLIAFGGAADTFVLDTQLRLSDRTDDNEFTSKNTQDPVPYLFLGDTADTANVPTCTVCDGYLHCDYPGTSNDVFALCDGYLALGPGKNFVGLPQCVVIGLEYSLRA